VADVEADLDFRILAAERTENAWQEVLGRGDHGNAQAPGGEAPQVVEGLVQAADAGEHVLAGLLHDPAWGIERAACTDLRDHLDAHTDLVTWFNRPYSGTADGILPAMRRRYTPETFVGIELEINQKYADDAAALVRIADAIGAGLERAPSLQP